MTDIFAEQNAEQQQQQQQQQEEFDDALHQLMNSIRRPTRSSTEGPEATELQELLARLTNMSESNHSRWKSMLLALIHKRYHILSPEAKAWSERETATAAGDGERRIYYLGARFFMDQMQADTPGCKELGMALQVLVRSAPLAGGSRDICALLVEAVESLLKHSEEFITKRKQMMDLDGKESLSALVACGVRLLEATSNSAASCLQSLLHLAADTLDQDLELVAALKKHGDDSPAMNQDQYPSTLHTFLPHCNRGRPKKRETHTKVPDRQVVNSVLEVMIWGRTATALGNKAFANAYERFLRPKQGDDTKQDMHILQTIARNYRKVLNTYARDQGYALADQFVLDDSKLSIQKVFRAKAGDLANLTRLARKKQSSQVMKMIQLRFASNPSKITKYDSVAQLLVSTTLDKEGGDELAQMERDIHLSRVKATVAHLRKLVKKHDEQVVVASMEHAESNHAVAALAAAAMCDWDVPVDDDEGMDVATQERPFLKLLIGGVERPMACFSDLMELLDAISAGLKSENDVATFMDDSGTATTKAVQNLIDRHLDDSGVLLLITSADIQLPDDDMNGLTSRGCSVHCHDADDMGERLRREEAERGDITISLAWDTGDDLDLHVLVPGDEEIFYQHRKSADGLCILDVDMNAGGPQSSEPVENVFLGKLDSMVEAPKGKYKVYVRNYGYYRTVGTTDTTAIPFRVVIEKNGTKEKYNGECVGEGENSDVTVCEFEYEGRSVPFPGEEKEKLAFEKANVVNLTASTGQTLESIGQLVQTVQQLKHLDVVRTLVDDGPGTEERPIVATTETLEVTNRDRVNMLLSKLPKTFHAIVGDVFGGPSLAEECAGEIARRMVAEKIPVSELGRAGYPDDVVAAVKIKMATSDAS